MTDVAGRLVRLAAGAGLGLAYDAAEQHAAYVALLAKWNRKINLTSLELLPPDDAALRRLIVEPLTAAAVISQDDRTLMDLGSGGGSPAIPLKIACPWLQLSMVESKAKKCAFLREAARSLRLTGVQVQQTRFEDLDSSADVDLISFRAVRADANFWQTVFGLLSPRGRVIWFGGVDTEVPLGLQIVSAGAPLVLSVTR